MKTLCILTDNVPSAEKLKETLTEYNITVKDNLEHSDRYDLIAIYDYNGHIDDEIIGNNKIINVHSSLLPSFDTKTPIKDAYLYGVKVTGVTVYELKGKSERRILAQYPVLIDNYTHYDQLEEEIDKLRLRLYPIVIKSVLENRVFDIVELLAPIGVSTCGACGKCGSGCHS